jgi:hypothetical protein
LKRLGRGETVIANLRPETDPETDYVALDRPRILGVLARIIADLDDVAGYPPIAKDRAVKDECAEVRPAWDRQRSAEPEPSPKRPTMREERAALLALLDPLSSKRG